MSPKLPQRSHKCSHKDASGLARKRGVYYFRRRLPEPLSGEIAVSLATRNYREAEHLAEVLNSAFLTAVHSSPTAADLRAVLRRYLEEALAEDTRARLMLPAGLPVYGLGEPTPAERDPVAMDEDVIAAALSDARRALAARDFQSVQATVAILLNEHGLPNSSANALAYGILEANVRLFEEAQRRTYGRSPVVLLPDPPKPAPATLPASPPIAPAPASPLFSALLPKYIDLAVSEKGWRGQSLAQNRATFAMFQEVCGDLPVNVYTRTMLSDFYNTLRALPALYSKDRRWRGLPLKEVVEASKEDAVPRLTMKTVKRHFSALGGFFTYAKRHGHVTGDNPAHGFEFPKKGRAKKGRQMWEGEKLRKLFQSPVWTGSHPTFRAKPGSAIVRDDKYWLPLLGVYHGNRLEEFAQLRREDVKCEDGIWYLHIHGEGGRQIKNDQSARRVPLHPEMERLGFISYVRATAPKSGDMVFPQLKPGGPDKKVGYYFTKWWTNYRKSIGLYEPGLDYHSFRHGVTTKLYAAGVARDVVDELTGHEGEGTSQRVYKHDTPLPKLYEAIRKVEWTELRSITPPLVSKGV
ncbi:site-specific integrase [uncultured Reyranella sp.]|uniref:site-specific integrase n=1 Tax=uncultured Reyranella sp. TaxID=735512 RepID=UPI00259C9C21|nr:site-specific integrase [uncultured Reyranella sp.]